MNRSQRFIGIRVTTRFQPNSPASTFLMPRERMIGLVRRPLAQGLDLLSVWLDQNSSSASRKRDWLSSRLTFSISRTGQPFDRR